MTMQNESNAKTTSYFFRLALPADKYLAFYKGHAQNIQVLASDGRKIQFPANAVRQFLTREGIYGDFEMQVDENNKLIGVSKR